jgi:hypothetical protein
MKGAKGEVFAAPLCYRAESTKKNAKLPRNRSLIHNLFNCAASSFVKTAEEREAGTVKRNNSLVV